MGAIAALKQNGRTDVKVYSFNATAPAVQAVKDGTMTATLGVDLTSAGKMLVDQIPDILAAGDALEAEILRPGLHARHQGQCRRVHEGQSAVNAADRGPAGHALPDSSSIMTELSCPLTIPCPKPPPQRRAPCRSTQAGYSLPERATGRRC